MSGIVILLLSLFNLAISYWNARVTGKVWIESKEIRGWIRVVVWAGAIMSAAGFTQVYILALCFGGMAFGLIPVGVASLALQLTYLLIIVPVISASIIITIHSWIAVSRERSLKTIGIAAYNTIATGYNVYSTVTSFGDVWDSVSEKFGEDFDSDSDTAKAIMLALIALFGGILTTFGIIRMNAGTLPLPEREAYA